MSGLPRLEMVSFHCPRCNIEFNVGMNASNQETANAMKRHAKLAHGEDISVRPKGTRRWL